MDFIAYDKILQDKNEIRKERLERNLKKAIELIGEITDHDIRNNRKKIHKAYDLLLVVKSDYERLGDGDEKLL